jgi:hypothetical protein
VKLTPRFIFLCFVIASACWSLIACTPFGGFRPPPRWWTYFSGDGASETEVRAALLECGSNIPGSSGEGDKFLMPDWKYFPETAFNQTVLVTECMRNSGFPYIGRSLKSMCAGGGADMYGNISPPEDIPACKPDAVIPIRSIENRLNSLYCKTYPKTRVCQPNYDPSTDHHSWKPVNFSPKSISIAPSIDPATKLQNQVQKDSNVQMNQLLQSAGGRK